MIVLKFPRDICPVGRLNWFNPEGHSGQLKLQAVVGSMERLQGIPQCFAFRVIRER